MSARYAIVRVDPRTHGRKALDLSVRNLQVPAGVTEARYPKYYERNPLGPPLLLFAQEVESQAFVGMAALFPAMLCIEGEAVLGGIGGDFAIERGHRGLGPALALQRGLLDALETNGFHFAYGAPNRFSEPVIARVGYADVGQVSRFVKILKAGILAREAVTRPAVARALATVGPYTVDPVLSVLSRERLHHRRAHVAVEHPERFDERFLDVFESMARQHSITSQRTPELLNWKYERGGEEAGERPRAYSIFAVTEGGGKVTGYVVYRTKDGVRSVQDIGFLPARPVVDTLLAEFIRDSRRQRAEAISLIHLGPESLLTRRLRSFAFVRRAEQSRLRVFVPDASALPADLVARDNWFFVPGDTDI
jgi:hypothetical protein